MDYTQLSIISSFLDPLADQSPIRIRRDIIERIQNARTQRLCQLAFGDKDELYLSRNNLFRLSTGNIERFLLSVLFWGYPQNNRGRCMKAFECWDSLIDFARQIRHHPDMNLDDYEQLIPIMHNNLPGLGISTLSKILYFSNATIEGKKCIILDDNEARGIASLTGPETIDLRTPLINGHHRLYRNYPLFLNALHDIANNLQIPAHNIEYTLWLVGKKNQ